MHRELWDASSILDEADDVSMEESSESSDEATLS